MKRTLALILALLCVAGTLASCKSKDKENEEGEVQLYNFDMTEYLNVPELSDIVVSMADIESEWQYAALKVRLENTYYEKLDDPEARTALYDKVLVDYTPLDYGDGTLTSELKAILTGDNEEMILGSGDAIPAYENSKDSSLSTLSFDEQLLDKKAGVSTTVNITFPDDYTFTDSEGFLRTDLQGVSMAFDVKILGIYRGDIPELTDELISSYSADEYTTVQAYKDHIYAYFKGTYAFEAFSLAASLKGGLPEEEMDSARVNYITSKIESEYADAELSDDDLRTLYDLYYVEANEYAAQAVYERMVLEYLFSVCSITLSDQEYMKKLTDDYNKSYYVYYVNYGVTTMSEYEDYFGRENLFIQYKYKMLLDAIVTKVTVVE